MADRILRRKATAERVGLHVRQLERLEAAGKFPRKVKVSDRASGWLESDVTAWIAARVAASLKAPTGA
jgi:prophage regulatory protein